MTFDDSVVKKCIFFRPGGADFAQYTTCCWRICYAHKSNITKIKKGAIYYFVPSDVSII
jgi:hypothetical protein